MMGYMLRVLICCNVVVLGSCGCVLKASGVMGVAVVVC